MSPFASPVKRYVPRPVGNRFLRAAGPSLVVAALFYYFVMRGNPAAAPAAAFVAALVLGSAVYLDVFSGRIWVYLYEDGLQIQGPIRHVLEPVLGPWITRTLIRYDRVTALGCSQSSHQGAVLLGTATFLIVHRRGRLWQRKFFIPCAGETQYGELKTELRVRVPATCRLYKRGSFGRREPMIPGE